MMTETLGRLLASILLTSFVAACGGGGSGGSGGGGSGPTPITPPPPPVAGFVTLSDAAWDDTAVRKVLQTFAYGGQTTDVQIAAWADMAPTAAIREMLTFDEHNLKLSVPVAGDLGAALQARPGTLRGLSDFWTSDDPDNGVQEGFRPFYESPLAVWYRATLSRGLNPFRQRIGLWETNYHMATNNRVGVSGDQTIRYYDDIMTALASGEPYENVIAVSALSAAVARQYGHFQNLWINGRCECNEDFAREFHQLFFGILGDYDSAYHENVAIKNTAAALTDMRLDFDPVTMDFVDTLVFGRTYHAPGPLDILNSSIAGNDASQKINELSRIAIEHPESLANLPVKIVSGLADDDLDEQKIDRIRDVWRGMTTKSLLDFLQGYAISETFHSVDRVKYQTSVDRMFNIANQVVLSNREVDLEIYVPYDLDQENVQIFSPRNNVFGGQTGLAAADSTEVFRNNYNRVTESYWRFALPYGEPFGQVWEKDWAAVIPQSEGGGWVTEDVAQWLWRRLVADGLKNFGDLERAHVLALLSSDFDLTALINRRELEAGGQDPNDPTLYDFNRVVTSADLTTDPDLAALIDELAVTELELGAENLDQRRAANLRVGQAINFIAGTPYVFIQEGR